MSPTKRPYEDERFMPSKIHVTEEMISSKMHKMCLQEAQKPLRWPNKVTNFSNSGVTLVKKDAKPFDVLNNDARYTQLVLSDEIKNFNTKSLYELVKNSNSFPSSISMPISSTTNYAVVPYVPIWPTPSNNVEGEEVLQEESHEQPMLM